MTEDRIGKFEIAGRIGTGGMADVYRCRLRGPGGFDKTVVVKRIRAERATDPCFVNMFLDEARLAANLSHPNIVQVFEIGEVDGAPFIAMEYVKGPTFAALAREARRRDRLHLGHLAKIVSGVCEGLHYAHSARGAGGEPLGLVHRDVSPQNIIVSGEGIPKLLDFGVAKANGRLTETVAGTLKGRLRYMSPEHLTGRVDHRADVFSLGICLYEATTGQNPHGPPLADEVALLGSIASGKFARPSLVCPDYPPALEDIVMWAMAADVGKRCPSAEALHARLEQFVAEGPFASSTKAVAAWVGELFPEPGDSGKVARPLPLTRRVVDPRRRFMSAFNPLAAVLSPETTGTASAHVTVAPPMRAGWRRRRSGLVLWAAALLTGGLVTASLLVRQGPPVPAPLVVTAPQPVEVLADRAAQAFLEAAEKLAASGQPAPASELLGKARALEPRDPPLRARLQKLARAVDAGLLLQRAAKHLADGQPREAGALAQQVLAEDSDNRTAADILSRARTGAQAPAASGGRAARARKGPFEAGTATGGPREPGSAPAAAEASGVVGEGETEPSIIEPSLGEPSRAPANDKPTAAASARTERGKAADRGVSADPASGIYSARPLPQVPPPKLPRIHRAQGPEDLERVLLLVEQEAVKAGCSASFTRGITGALSRALAGQTTPVVYPAALYYLIVREAALGREREAAGRELASAHRSGLVKALNKLPVDTRSPL